MTTANINRWIANHGPTARDRVAMLPQRQRVDVHGPIAFLQSIYGQPWVREFILQQNGDPVQLAAEIRKSARARAAEILGPDDYPADSVYWQARAERDLQGLEDAMGDKERYQDWLDEMMYGLDTWRSIAIKAADALAVELERVACRA